jgi:hypothetical protein
MCERRENYGTVYTQEKKKYIESSTIEREREREREPFYLFYDFGSKWCERGSGT